MPAASRGFLVSGIEDADHSHPRENIIFFEFPPSASDDVSDVCSTRQAIVFSSCFSNVLSMLLR
jgi:hypothetical protein